MMHQFLCGRLVLSLVGTVAVLQIIHIVLLNRLESRQVTKSPQFQPKLTQPSGNVDTIATEIEAELSSIVSFVERSWVLDAHGEYHVSIILPKSNEPVDSVHDVTLVTQCSHNHFSKLVPLLIQWQGPVSFAVFTTSELVWDILYKVAKLRVSHESVKLNVSFSIVWPVSPSVRLPPRNLHHISNSTVTHNYNSFEAYPNNLLRNIARKAAFTDFIFVIDVDMMPSSGMRQDFLHFINRSGWVQMDRNMEKTVFVIPAFEGNILPHKKMDLISAVEAGKVRPFYSQLCWKCQAHTDYDTWLHWPLQKQLSVIYDVLWKDPWEPFYVSHKSVPLYDDRFKQYGFNRISQVCELHVSGYKFSVLNNAFLLHKGFKTQSSFHPSKEKELELNRLLYRQFKEELKYKYPESSRRCY